MLQTSHIHTCIQTFAKDEIEVLKVKHTLERKLTINKVRNLPNQQQFMLHCHTNNNEPVSFSQVIGLLANCAA